MRAGDTGRDVTFEAFFRAQLPRVLRTAQRVLGDEASAEDAAAEAFARAHARWHKVGELPYRDAWVLRVASNVAIDMCRKGARTVTMAEPRPDLPSSGEPDEHEHVLLRLALVGALAALPRRQREVVALHFFEGLTEAEVAECLHVSVGTVKKTSSRARDALRSRLGEDWQGFASSAARA